MEIIDALYAENSKLIQLLNMKIRDIDDEQ